MPLTALEIYQRLLTAYGPPRWWSEDPYTVLFQAVLVQNTAWNNVEKTTAAIGSRMTPSYISLISLEKLEDMIRPCGFFKAKARTIKALTAWFEERKETIRTMSTEAIRKELMDIKGIGEESADVILVYAFHRSSFIIDAYTRRFLSRLGLDFRSDDERKAFFRSTNRENAEIDGFFHWLMLDHGKMRCRKTPECQDCPFSDECNYTKIR